MIDVKGYATSHSINPADGKPIPNMQLSGSNVAQETNKVVTADTDILVDYTAPNNIKSTLMVLSDVGGALSVVIDGAAGAINSGVPLESGKWYAFEILLLKDSVYNLQFSADAELQIKWIGGA